MYLEDIPENIAVIAVPIIWFFLMRRIFGMTCEGVECRVWKFLFVVFVGGGGILSVFVLIALADFGSQMARPSGSYKSPAMERAEKAFRKQCEASRTERTCEDYHQNMRRFSQDMSRTVGKCEVFGETSITTFEQTCSRKKGEKFSSDFLPISVVPLPVGIRLKRELTAECKVELANRGCPYHRTEFANGEDDTLYIHGTCYAAKKALFSDSRTFRVNGFHCTRGGAGGLYVDFFRPNISRDPADTSQTPLLSEKTLLW